MVQRDQRKHRVMGLLAILAIGPNLMLNVATMLGQVLFQNSFSRGSYATLWPVILGNIAFFIFSPLGPVLVRWIGLRATYVRAMILFAVGSLIACLAPNLFTLAIGRILEGAMAGSVFLVMVPLLIQSFPVERRNRVLAVLVSGFFGSIALGPLLGALAMYLDAWRWLFVLPIATAVTAGLIGIKVLPIAMPLPPAVAQGGPHQRTRFDWGGIFLMLAHGIALSVTFGHLGGRNFSDPSVEGPLVVTILLLAALVIRELTASNPLLDLRLLFSWKTGCGTLLALASNVVMIFSLAGMTTVLRTVNHTSNVAVVIFSTGIFAGVIASALLMTLLHDKIGPGLLGLIGSLSMLTVELMWGHMDFVSSLVQVWWELGLLGTGAGLTVASGLVGAALGRPKHLMPKTMVAVQAVRLLFFTAIAPLFSWLVETRSTVQFDRIAWSVSALNPFTQYRVQQLMTTFQAHGVSERVAKHAAVYAIYTQLRMHALIRAIHNLFEVSIGITIVMVLLSAIMSLTGKGAPLAVKPQTKPPRTTEVSSIASNFPG